MILIQSPKIKSLKMFNILVGTKTLSKNYQTFKKSILEQWMRFLGFLPFFYLGFWGFQIPQFKFQKFKHDAQMEASIGQARTRDVTTHPH